MTDAAAFAQASVVKSLKPPRSIRSVVGLPGSPYLLAGDSEGFMATWFAGEERVANDEDPDHIVNAHSGPVTAVVVLSNSGSNAVLQGVVQPVPTQDEPKKEEEEAGKLERTDSDRSRLGASAHAEVLAVSKPGALRRFCSMLSRKQKKVAPDDSKVGGGDASSSGSGTCTGQKLKNKKGLKYWLVCSSGEDGTLRLSHWRLDKQKVNRLPIKDKDTSFDVDFKFKWTSEGKKPIIACLELHDGLVALAIQDFWDVCLVDLPTQTLKWKLYGHTAPLTALGECQDGRLVTGSKDGSIRLWRKRMAWKQSQEGGEKPELLPLDIPSQEGAYPAGHELPGIGVSSSAYFAHMHSAPTSQGENVSALLRVLVKNVKSLPNSHMFGAPDRVVACTILEGQMDLAAARCPSKANARYECKCPLSLKKTLVDGQEELPESLRLDFEIYAEPRIPGSAETLIAVWSIPIQDVLDEIAGQASPQPRQRVLGSPEGEEPVKPLKDCGLFVSFEQPKAADRAGDIDVRLDRAVGLPLGVGQSSYVRMAVRERGAEMRTVPTRYVGRTRVLRSSVEPLFDEVLELEIPVTLVGRRAVFSPDLHLKVEVFDHDSKEKMDYQVAHTTMPLSRALQSKDGTLEKFDLTLGPGRNGIKKQQTAGKGAAASDLREAADASAAPKGSAKIYMSFEMITLCPNQLRCTVDFAHGLPACTNVGSQPSVRVRLTPGNMLLPRLTAVRTSTQENTCKPVWSEKCILQLPKWCRVAFKKPGHLKSSSVRSGWEHEGRPLPVYVCVDVYHWGNGLVDDKLITRVCIPLDEAMQQATSDPRASIVKKEHMSYSTEPELYLGFQALPNVDQLSVIVEKADKLPSMNDRGHCDAFCVVRLTEYTSLREPADKVVVSGLDPVVTPKTLMPSAESPQWYYEGLLELPGAIDVGGTVGARPNWHVSIEVVETDVLDKRDIVLAQTSLPLSDLLSDIADTESGTADGNPRADMLNTRMEKLRRTDVNAVSLAPTGVAHAKRSREITRDFQLIPGRGPRQSVSGDDLKKAALAQLGDEEDDKSSKKRHRTAQNPTTEMLHQALEQVGNHITGSFDKALRILGLGDDGHLSMDKTKDPALRQPQLRVRFEVISRTLSNDQEKRAGKKWPKPMHEPCPVTCITTVMSTVVAGYDNGRIFVWDTTGSATAPLHQLEAHAEVPVISLCYYPKLDVLVSAGAGKTHYEAATEGSLRIWNCSSMQKRQDISLHGATCRSLRNVQLVDCKGPPCIVVAANSRQKEMLQLLRFDV